MAQATLTRAEVIAAGGKLLEDHGVEALSMRALARALGVGVSTLYWHVRDKQDLLDAIVEDAVRPLHVPREGPWEQRFAAFLRESRAILRARPALVPLFWTSGWALGPETLRVADELVGLVAEAGLPETEVADAYYAVLSFLIGFVRLETLAPDTPPYEPLPGAAILPNLRRYGPASDAAGMDRRFALGVELLIAGLRARHPSG
jgi:TetR/AcrR family tetracycline transcriptional repressor